MREFYDNNTVDKHLDSQWCGIWQVYQEVNVLQYAVMLIYPDISMEMQTFYSDLHWYLLLVCISYTEMNFVYIMYTKGNRNAKNFNHLVPVAECM